MFDNGGSGPERAQEVVQRLLTASNTDSVLARQLSDAQAAFLVLDADGTRILHASPAALALRRAIADPDGRLDPVLRIGDGIARARPLRDTPLLLRLTLDRRRILPPVTMTLLRAADDAGLDLLVLLANAPLPRLRPRPVPVAGERRRRRLRPTPRPWRQPVRCPACPGAAFFRSRASVSASPGAATRAAP